MNPPRTERSLGDLFSDLSEQTSGLIQQEMRLAKAELSEKLDGLAQHAMMIGAGAVFALAAVGAATATIVLLLIYFGVQPWLSGLITTVVMGLIAFVLAKSGISALSKRNIVPVETLHSIKETAQWLKHPSTR